MRSPDEYADAHIDGALNIPLDVLAERAAELSGDAVLVTACGKGGGRSERGAALLRELGFASVRSVCGGTQAWLALRPHGPARSRGP